MAKDKYADLFFETDVAALDAELDEIIRLENERQRRRIILIPSESYAPQPVREALGSVFTNIYAEGYPPLRMTRDDEEQILDFAHQLVYYRRYADRRFYKGADYVHFVETLAQRRAAQCFATDRTSADDLYVNVQALSGAAANLAVYDALMEPGDTLMGLDLFQGGHLTHGSEFNVSGKRYQVVSYSVDPKTERLDYDQIMELALESKPKVIVAGYTSYPWAPNWEKFREIADACGAYLMADISHPAGMTIAGYYPNPIDYVDVATFTTHKTLCGPRGAVIMTPNEDLGDDIDMAIFPGEQGGPHTNKFAAMAMAFKIAQTEAFKDLQQRIVENAQALAKGLTDRGLRLAYGGTDTHLMLLDLKSVESPTGYPLYGELAVRVLELAGIVANKNTIPGDPETAVGTGVRFGTPWVTQRGMTVEQMDELADLIHRVVTNLHPFYYEGLIGTLPRGKMDLDILEGAKRDVDKLAATLIHEGGAVEEHDYPHFPIMPENPQPKQPVLVDTSSLPKFGGLNAAHAECALFDRSDMGILKVGRGRAYALLQESCTADLSAVHEGQLARSFMLNKDGKLLDDIVILRDENDKRGRASFFVLTNPENTEYMKAWLRGLADGYILFDNEDVFRKVQGPATVEDFSAAGWMSLELYGPQSWETLKKVMPSAPDLAENSCAMVDGAVVARGSNDLLLHVLLMAPEAKARELWEAFEKTGVEVATPVTRAKLREDAGWPVYDGDERPAPVDLYEKVPALFNLNKPYFVGQAHLASKRQPSNLPEFAEPQPAEELKRTPLYEAHKKLTKRIVPFAGWEMPVWYTSNLEEHKAVRSGAGVFDVMHMGAFEVAGPYATSFLDVVTSNYVRWLDDLQSHYTYLFDPDGNVIDDLMIYKRNDELYLVVVNAANEDKDWAWLNAVNNREVVIDREHTGRMPEQRAILRNLKDPKEGDRRKQDMALQGPASLTVLQRLADDRAKKLALARVSRTDLIEITLSGIELVIARTGYTGEDWGYEIFVHPDQAEELWNLLLERGADLGVKPAGLAARDSTRMEAGLPLYGHELAGQFNISPTEAGFAGYVKFHKPYFIGRRPYVDKYKDGTNMEVVRFRMNETGIRVPHTGQPVVNKRGQYIGWVTSCAIDTAGRLIGLAYIDKRYHRVGEQIAVFPVPEKDKKGVSKLAIGEAKLGDKLLLENWATVLTRFIEDEEWEEIRVAARE